MILDNNQQPTKSIEMMTYIWTISPEFVYILTSIQFIITSFTMLKTPINISWPWISINMCHCGVKCRGSCDFNNATMGWGVMGARLGDSKRFYLKNTKDINEEKCSSHSVNLSHVGYDHFTNENKEEMWITLMATKKERKRNNLSNCLSVHMAWFNTE